MGYSATYAGAIVAFLGFLLGILKVDFDQGQLTEAISGLLGFLGFVWTLWGRYRAGGITAAGVKVR